MPERQFGPYRLIHQIATGGMAEIYLARTKGIGGFEKFIALKMIHPNFSADDHFIQMLVDEAKISVQLQHVNIAQVFDLGRVGGTYYITMEFVDGCDLYKVLRKASEKDVPMPIDVAVHIAKEVCMGLDYAHRKRDADGRPLDIIHRDISPQNVLVSNAAEVKIVDFGIAKASMRAKQTAVGVIKGKYYYMSPEQAWGDPLDARTDLFSAGILLYEMLTGQMLYLEEDMQKLLDMVRKADIPPPSTRRKGLPPTLDKLVMKALAKKREQRFASAQDFGAELEKFLHAWAPEFSSARVASFVRQVVGDPQPLPVAEETNVGAGPGGASGPGGLAARITRGMGREDLMAREEFEDENSVIFRLNDLARSEAEARAANGASTAKPKPSSTVGSVFDTPGGRASATAGAAAPRGTTRPAPPSRPPPIPPGAARPPGAPARPPPAPTRPPPAPPRPPAAPPPPPPAATPRRLAARPATRSEPDSTVVSDPPGFGGTTAVSEAPLDDLPDDPAFDTIDRVVEKSFERIFEDDQPTGRTRALPPRPTTDERSDEEPTRLDVGLLTPTPAPAPRPPAAAGAAPAGKPAPARSPASTTDAPTARGRGALVTHAALAGAPGTLDRPLDEDDPLEAPTSRQRSRDALSPVQGARSPTPAVSALAPPRSSRRTPTSGVPADAALVFPPPRAGADDETVPPAPAPGSAVVTPATDFPLSAPFPTPPPPPPAQDGSAAPWAPQPEAPPPWPMAPGYPGAELALGDDGGEGLATLAPSRRGLLWWTLGAAAAIAIVAAVVAMLRAGSPAPATVASIEVISIPAGASVKVDGQPLPGVTPLTWSEAQPGKSYRLVVELPRHEPWQREESLPDNARQVKVIASLKPILGRLGVTSEPTGAEVFLNNRSVGRTPLLLPSVDPFVDSKVEVRLRGHKPAVQPVVWPADHNATLAFKLAPN